MQQYVLRIIEQLERRGYVRLNPDSNNVYGRVCDTEIYVVVVGSGHNLTADNLRKFDDRIKNDLMINTGKPVFLLNLLITETGIFDGNIRDIVNGVENVWIVTEDYGKLYVFENQPPDFDGLYLMLDKKIKPAEKDRKKRIRDMFGIITPAIVLINVIIYIVGTIKGEDSYGRTITTCKMGLNLSAVLNDHEFYRLFTAMFVHLDIMHLCSNMLVLEALGAKVESVFGRVKFVIIYVLSGLIASTASLISCFFGEAYGYAAGASGAIFGLMGALIAYALINKNKDKSISLENLVILCALNIINGYLSKGIDNAAHVGGLMAGFIIGAVIMLFNQKVVKQ